MIRVVDGHNPDNDNDDQDDNNHEIPDDVNDDDSMKEWKLSRRECE